jgi:DNA-binding HxlR family transcriptional regulator
MDQTVSDFKASLEGRKAAGESGVLAECPVRAVMHGISGKWTASLLMALAERPHRFGELRRLFRDLSQRMLTQTLHDLQRDGYVRRQVLPTNPPSVEYSLTLLGSSLFQQLRTVLQWATVNHHAVLAAREAFDADGPSKIARRA